MTKDNNKQIHEILQADMQEIKDSLVSIDKKFEIQNGKVARAESGIIELSYTTRDLLRSITTDATRIKALEDKQQEQIERELAILRNREVTLRERLLWGLVVTVLFILGFVGIINVDFIQSLL